jgi:hypothetical protein
MNHLVQAVSHLDKLVGSSKTLYFNVLYVQFMSQLGMGAEQLEILESAVLRLSKVQQSLEQSSAVVL